MLETQSFRRQILLGGVFLLFFRTAFNTHNQRFYLRDHKYWSA